MKVLLFANTDWYLYNFRLALANSLREQGHSVLLVSPPGPYGDRLRELGFEWRPFAFSTRSTNLFAELSVLRRLVRLYRTERPDLLHHFTVKCVLYGSLAARLSGGPPVINAVTGLGHVFTDSGLKVRLLRPLVRMLYRLALDGVNRRTIFQNDEDRSEFLRLGLAGEARTRVIRGSGVSGERFRPRGESGRNDDTVVILFASRLLREKGLFELRDALRRLRQERLPVRLQIAGDIYPDNPSSLTLNEMRTLQAEPGIEYLGHVDDMPTVMEKADIVVLPSYREGTPRVLIEAAAAGKPIVATDIGGCRGLVADGVNGLLVPVRDVAALTDALRRLVLDGELRRRFGTAGRQIFECGFSEELVLRQSLEVYGELLGDVPHLELSPAWRLLRQAISSPSPRARAVFPSMTPADWDDLYEACRRHGLFPLVSSWLGRSQPYRVPDRQRRRFRDAAAVCMLRSIRMQRELQRLLALFAESGIPPIPFKGPALAERAFGDVGMRVFDDLDILIPEKFVPSAVAVLEAQGYGLRQAVGGRGWTALLASTNQVEMAHPLHPWMVEIHWDFAKPRHRFRVPLASVWAGVEPGSAPGALDDEMTLLQLCIHGTSHYWSKLKWVVDIDRLVRTAPHLDWDRLFAQAEAIGCTRQVVLGLALARDCCGTAPPAACGREFHALGWLKRFAVTGWHRPEKHRRPVLARAIFFLLCRPTTMDRLLAIWSSVLKNRAAHTSASHL